MAFRPNVESSIIQGLPVEVDFRCYLPGAIMPKKTKRLRLKSATEQLTAIAEKHLAALPEQEKDAKVDTFAQRIFVKA